MDCSDQVIIVPGSGKPFCSSSGLPSFLYPHHAHVHSHINRLAGIGAFWFKAGAGRGGWCEVLSIIMMEGSNVSWHYRPPLPLFCWDGQGHSMLQLRLAPVSWPHMIPASRARAQCQPDSRITNIMKSFVIALALVAGAVAKPGGYTGDNITLWLLFWHYCEDT